MDHKFSPLGNENVPRDMRRQKQAKLLTYVRRCAVVATVACYTGSQELIVKSVTKGYELASYLLFIDDRHISGPLQNPLIMLLVTLQTVPKRNWHQLEHKLYTRLLHHTLKLAIQNRSTAGESTSTFTSTSKFEGDITLYC